MSSSDSSPGPEVWNPESVVVTESMANGPRLKDLGAMDAVLEKLKKVIDPLYGGEVSSGRTVVAGVLLRGPPGSGKTTLVEAIAEETLASFYRTSATEFASGEILDLFSKASASVSSIVFIDDLNSIPSIETEHRIMEELNASVDQFLQTFAEKPDRYLLLIGATSRRDRGFMQMPCFQLHLTIDVPDEKARMLILSVLTRDCKLDADLLQISRSTPHFVAADLKALVEEAKYGALSRCLKVQLPGEQKQREDWFKAKLTCITEQQDRLRIVTQADFEEASKRVQPYFGKLGFLSIPDVTWEDVVGLAFLRNEFYSHIVTPVKFPDEHKKSGVDSQTVFLLHGRPGCGKRLAARAAANEAGIPFVLVKAIDLMKKWCDEKDELAIRSIFSNARACSPCILFFHEIDILEGITVNDGIVQQLVVELNDTEDREGVFIICSSYKENVTDAAFFWPGCFGKHLHVPLPGEGEHGLILEALSRQRPLEAGLDMLDFGLSKLCQSLSGGQLKSAMDFAEWLACLEQKRTQATSVIIKAVHIKKALEQEKQNFSASLFLDYSKES